MDSKKIIRRLEKTLKKNAKNVYQYVVKYGVRIGSKDYEDLQYELKYIASIYNWYDLIENKDVDVVVMYKDINNKLLYVFRNRDYQIIEIDADSSVQKGTEFSKSTPKNGYVDMLKKQAADFLEKVSFPDFLSTIQKSVIGQPNLELFLAGVYNYIENVSKSGIPQKINTILAAPSGCGKTETYRALRKYFKKEIPLLIVGCVDLTQITTEGFKGRDTVDIVEELITHNTGGYGILFLDEFDKRLTPQHSSSGEDVSKDVQGQLLALIEGKIEYKKTKNSTTYINTERTMFIGCGSFNTIRQKKKEKAEAKHIGFLEQKEEYDFAEDITREDLLEFGCTYELVGRFISIINYHVLSEKALRQVIDKEKKGY